MGVGKGQKRTRQDGQVGGRAVALGSTHLASSPAGGQVTEHPSPRLLLAHSSKKQTQVRGRLSASRGSLPPFGLYCPLFSLGGICSG